jgi:O-acetyl-ADP-ribose deacetylase (regulator of RNase III)
MTAGIDAAVARFFGEPLVQRVQHRVMDEFFGEQPVGTAFVVATGHPTVPFLAHAPTMRVPGSIAGTDKVYNATWPALLAIHAHNRVSEHPIEVAAFPAMGTGFGGVSYGEAARQMAAAYRHYQEPPHRLDGDFVVERQKAIHYDNGSQVIRYESGPYLVGRGSPDPARSPERRSPEVRPVPQVGGPSVCHVASSGDLATTAMRGNPERIIRDPGAAPGGPLKETTTR